MGVEHLSDSRPDGVTLGQDSTDKISFYGATPVTKQSAATAVATTVAVSTSTNWGYSGSTQANAIVTLVNDLRSELVELGLLSS